MREAGFLLLERSAELDLVRDQCARVVAGSGLVIAVEGPAGIGKTSMLEATRELAREAGLSVEWAHAGRLEQDLPWNLVRQLFAGVITSDERPRGELLEGAAALAGPALGVAPALTAPADEAGALHGLYWLTTALAAQSPVLFAVDDAHWGDSSSLRYLSYLGERAGDLPVLLVLAVRAGERRPEPLRQLEASTRTQRLRLHELTGAGTATLTRAMLGREASDEFCSACHAVTAGNPFLLKELLGQLERDGVDPTAARAAEVADVTPETVRRAVLMRLSALEAGAHELARAVAVLGEPAQLREAATLAALDQAHAAGAADALTGAEILASETPLRFVHPLVREAIYAEVPAHQRAVIHGRAARLLAELGGDPRRIAIQLLRTEPAGDSWVLDRLREAAAGALSAGARDPALEFLRRALAEPPDGSLRVEVLRELAQAEALAGSVAAIEHLETALALTERPQERGEIGLELAFMLLRHGHVRSAAELSRSLLDELPSGERGLELGLIAAAVTGGVLVPELQPQVGRLLARIPTDLPGETPEERLALSARLAALLVSRGAMDEVADLAERALGGEMLLRDLASSEPLYWNATSALIVADRFDPAGAAIEAAFADARRRGSVVGFALCSCFRSVFHYRVGDITAGTADGRQALAVTDPSEFQVHAYAVAFLIDCLIERGELEEALALATAPQFASELPALLAFELLRVARGRLRVAAGDVEQGVEELLSVGETAAAGGFGTGVCPWRARAAVGLRELGRNEEARALAEQELSLARATRSGWGEAIALQALAVAAPENGSDLLRDAIELSERCGFALERARALVLLGAAERRRGQRRAAADLLGEGLDAAATCGALAVEERARAELVAIGLAPRRRQLSGVDALTPAERRVAELAVSGMSNREIAQALFVSLRTVETHLTHCYQKLGIESRAQLGPPLQAS
jgi:DNA-binding CsgD family transcriptional regulator